MRPAVASEVRLYLKFRSADGSASDDSEFADRFAQLVEASYNLTAPRPLPVIVRHHVEKLKTSSHRTARFQVKLIFEGPQHAEPDIAAIRKIIRTADAPRKLQCRVRR